MSDSLQPHGLVAHQTALSMEFSRQENGECSHSLLQGIFQIQELNLGLPQAVSLCVWGTSLLSKSMVVSQGSTGSQYSNSFLATISFCLVCLTLFHIFSSLTLFLFYRKTALPSFYQEIELHQHIRTPQNHLDLPLVVL